MAREYDKTHYKVLREKVLIRDGYTCYYCGQEANTVDHIVPISKGGISSDENMIAACTRCNSGKRDRIAPGSFLTERRRLSTPIGNFLPGETETRRHYA
jgi:5-methylcytosine-specific restriction endonuclease McrA